MDMVIKMGEYNTFQSELCCLINRYSKESGSDTPDFILAEYMLNCLESYNKAVKKRDKWYGHPIDDNPRELKYEG